MTLILFSLMTQTITNRDLLREYSKWKGKLLDGNIDVLIIPQRDGSTLKIMREKPKRTFDELLDMIRKKPWKHLRRPKQDIF